MWDWGYLCIPLIIIMNEYPWRLSGRKWKLETESMIDRSNVNKMSRIREWVVIIDDRNQTESCKNRCRRNLVCQIWISGVLGRMENYYVTVSLITGFFLVFQKTSQWLYPSEKAAKPVVLKFSCLYSMM